MYVNMQWHPYPTLKGELFLCRGMTLNLLMFSFAATEAMKSLLNFVRKIKNLK